MGKGKFDKKQAVRFTLVPGPDKDGKPTVLYKPVQTHKSKLTKKERKNIISQLSDYDEITINGKKVNQNEIPAFILEQISGRKDLVFNQKREEVKQQEQIGDLYDVQDGRQDDQLYEYEDHDYEEEELQYIEEEGNNDDDWQDEDQDDDVQQIEEEIIEKQEKVVQKYTYKDEDFPVIEELVDVQIEGVTYKLTKAQAKLIDTIIPQNYEQLDFGGLQFKKYNQDGLLISDKAKYQKYFLKENQKAVVIDTYQYIPPKPADSNDNDFKPSQINGNIQLKEIEQALNYNGEQQLYEEIEDDFFAKMIQMQMNDKSNLKNQEQPKAKKTKSNTKLLQLQSKQSKEERSQMKQHNKIKKQKQQIKEVGTQKTQKQLEDQLQKALFNFQNNIEEQGNEIDLNQQQQDGDDEGTNKNLSMNFTDLEKREEYIGRDGQLDWRCLTKKQKKQYMKTKVIRQYYDELRQRQIQEKMQGKSNVTPDQLHLKILIKHIPYEEDHVMKTALEEDLKVKVDLDASLQEDYSSLSSEDDIVSFHQKTSIIASNLSVIEEPKKKKKPKNNDEDKSAEENVQQFSKIKVVPQKRNKNQTKQERKERKEKLRAQKKEKKEQKKQFAQQFSKIKKDMMKKQNPNNPLHKIAFVKIH